MPQILAVMSGASVNLRPRMKASKNRGGSKIPKLHSETLPSRMATFSQPSPSTLVMYSTPIRRVSEVTCCLREFGGAHRERPQRFRQIGPIGTSSLPGCEKRGDVRMGRRTKAPVTSATERGADRSTSSPGDGTEAGDSGRDQQAGGASLFAFVADRVLRNVRTTARQERRHQIDQLVDRNRAAIEGVVDSDVIGNRGGGGEYVEVLGTRVHLGGELVHVCGVAKRLDPSRRGARSDGHEDLALLTNLPDPQCVMGRRYRPLDQPDGVGGRFAASGCLGELHDVNRTGDGHDVVFGVEDRKLAPVTRGELEDRKRRFHTSLTPMNGATREYGNTGPSLHTK